MVSYKAKHLRGWISCTFSSAPEFVAKTQKFSVPDLLCIVDFLSLAHQNAIYVQVQLQLQ